jgi:hypothetical protein
MLSTLLLDGLQLSMGEGIIARTAEKVVDAVVNTPTAANFIVSQVVDYAKAKAPDPVLLEQVIQTLAAFQHVCRKGTI